MRPHLIRNFPNAKIPCLSTIGRYMRTQRRLSYKTLEKKHPTSTRPENWRKFFESAWVQSILEKQGVELIYLDEFSIITRHLKYKGWSSVGHKGYISVNLEEFSMSFIWALSKETSIWNYGLFRINRSHRCQTFHKTLVSLQRRNSIFNKYTLCYSFWQCICPYLLTNGWILWKIASQGCQHLSILPKLKSLRKINLCNQDGDHQHGFKWKVRIYSYSHI